MWAIETKLFNDSDWVTPRVSIRSESIEDLERFIKDNDFDRVYDVIRFISTNGEVISHK